MAFSLQPSPMGYLDHHRRAFSFRHHVWDCLVRHVTIPSAIDPPHLHQCSWPHSGSTHDRTRPSTLASSSPALLVAPDFYARHSPIGRKWFPGLQRVYLLARSAPSHRGCVLQPIMFSSFVAGLHLVCSRLPLPFDCLSRYFFGSSGLCFCARHLPVALVSGFSFAGVMKTPCFSEFVVAILECFMGLGTFRPTRLNEVPALERARVRAIMAFSLYLCFGHNFCLFVRHFQDSLLFLLFC